MLQQQKQAQKERAAVDDKALSLLTMALTNEMYARVDCLVFAKEVWDEIELQLQGLEEAKEDEREIAMSAYEGFKAKEGEPLFDSYTRLNGFVSDFRRIGVQKTNYEINVKFLKNITKAWEQAAIQLQMTLNLRSQGLHDIQENGAT